MHTLHKGDIIELLWVCYKLANEETGLAEFVGVFDDEEKAIAACTHDLMYIAEVELNVSLGTETCDAPGDIYYPRLETKEKARERGAGKAENAKWPR